MLRLTVPTPFALLTGRLPAYPGSLLLVSALNLVLDSGLPEDVSEQILGKHLRLYAEDVRMSFDFHWTKNGFVAGWNRGVPDLMITATAQDFLLMATRREDPDTLFFNRRLKMEGDTELGLIVKNTLDAVDWHPSKLLQFKPVQLLAQFWAVWLTRYAMRSQSRSDHQRIDH